MFFLFCVFCLFGKASPERAPGDHVLNLFMREARSPAVLTSFPHNQFHHMRDAPRDGCVHEESPALFIPFPHGKIHHVAASKLAFPKRQKTQKIQKTQIESHETICFIKGSCFLDNKNKQNHYKTNGFLIFSKVCHEKTQTEIVQTLQKQWFRQFHLCFLFNKLEKH